jgi:hypothetical protein
MFPQQTAAKRGYIDNYHFQTARSPKADRWSNASASALLAWRPILVVHILSDADSFRVFPWMSTVA